MACFRTSLIPNQSVVLALEGVHDALAKEIDPEWNVKVRLSTSIAWICSQRSYFGR